MDRAGLDRQGLRRRRNAGPVVRRAQGRGRQARWNAAQGGVRRGRPQGLPAAEITAVETILKPRKDWVRDATGFDALTDEIHRARGGSGKRGDATWKELNGRIPKLVVVAEANIVNAMKIANRPVTAELWAEFRGRFIASISKTIWRYHEDNIVDASVFGTPIKKSNVGQGFHRDVAEAFKLVEKSALRLSGKSTIAELKSAEGAEGKDTGARKTRSRCPGRNSGSSPCHTRAGCASTGS